MANLEAHLSVGSAYINTGVDLSEEQIDNINKIPEIETTLASKANLDDVDTKVSEEFKNFILYSGIFSLADGVFTSNGNGVSILFDYNWNDDVFAKYRHPFNKIRLTFQDADGNTTSNPIFFNFDSNIDVTENILMPNYNKTPLELTGDYTLLNTSVGLNYTYTTKLEKVTGKTVVYLYSTSKQLNTFINCKIKFEVIIYNDNIYNAYGYTLDRSTKSIYPIEVPNTPYYETYLKNSMVIGASNDINNTDDQENMFLLGSSQTIYSTRTFSQGSNNKDLNSSAYYNFIFGVRNTSEYTGGEIVYNIHLIGEYNNNTAGFNNINLIGRYLSNASKEQNLFMIGSYGEANEDTLFAIANGTSDASNICFEVKDDGTVYINGQELLVSKISEMESTLNTKADSDNVYTKAEVDALIAEAIANALNNN